MNKYPAILIVVCAILGGVLARDFVLPAASAQPIGQPAGAQLPLGRYQVEAFSSPGGVAQVVVIDTATAHCWLRAANGSWLDYGTPLPKAQTIALPQ